MVGCPPTPQGVGGGRVRGELVLRSPAVRAGTLQQQTLEETEGDDELARAARGEIVSSTIFSLSLSV